MEIIVTIGKLNEIDRYHEAGATGMIFCDEFHGTRAPSKMSHEELIRAFQLTHAKGCSSAVLMNRIYTDDELEKVNEYLLFLKENKIDYIYYNDPAVFMLAEKLQMVHHLIYDPDTLMTNSRDMKFIVDQGVHHAVLSPEITSDEMKQIIENMKGNTEAIVFGYLNMSYSKRHLINSYCDEIGIMNSCTNKMNCYLVESTRDGHMPILEDDQGTHIYTDYVLNAFEECEEFRKMGLKRVRLDSIFLPVEMVAEACEIVSGQRSLSQEQFEAKYKNTSFSKGYMIQKTNLVK